jgi:Lon protease-like protein
MVEMPLFPLNTVLFPGAPLKLHIFEQRYLDMIAFCMEKKKPFGVVLIRDGVEAMGPLAKPHSIGCSAQITQVEELPAGRLNIIVVGKERFRILSLDTASEPYMIGNIEPYPMQTGETQSMQEVGERLRTWLDRYLNAFNWATTVKLDISQLPQDPVYFACMAATILQIPLEQKQELLAVERAADFIKMVESTFKRELALLRATNFGVNPERDEPFSRN